jgi:predicted nuclease of predicted toxin-antitoxin system
MRLLLDHNLSPRVAEQLSNRGHDVATARSLGLDQVSDEEPWRSAIQEGLVVATYNCRDFLALSEKLWNEEISHPGLVLIFKSAIANSDIGGQVKALEALLNQDPDLTNQQHYLRPV